MQSSPPDADRLRTLELNQAVLAELNKLAAEQYKLIVHAILGLLVDPRPANSVAVEGTPYRRLVIGRTRIVYAADEECIHLVAVGTRKDGVL